MDVSARLQQVATGRRTFVVFLVALAFSSWFFSIGPYAAMRTHGGILDERFGITGGQIVDGLDAMGADGRAAYGVFLAVDPVFALLQGAWMTLFVAYGARRFQRLPGWLVWWPIAAMVTDWLENAVLGVALRQFPDVSVAGVAAGAIYVKFAGSTLGTVAAVAVVVMFITNPVERRRKR